MSSLRFQLDVVQIKGDLINLKNSSISAPFLGKRAHYYVKKLPIALSIENWLCINLMSFFICMVLLIIPALIIQKVEPVKAMRYE